MCWPLPDGGGRTGRAVKTLFLGPLFLPSTLSPGKETLGTRLGKKLDYNAVAVETLVSCISEAIDIFSTEFVIIIIIIIIIIILIYKGK